MRVCADGIVGVDGSKPGGGGGQRLHPRVRGVVGSALHLLAGLDRRNHWRGQGHGHTGLAELALLGALAGFPRFDDIHILGVDVDVTFGASTWLPVCW